MIKDFANICQLVIFPPLSLLVERIPTLVETGLNEISS